jgi:signal transduction histidine kinase|tara:strand:- start:3371 stop:3838 length:468 start_codon:yes stop_codon:yes gene_type:complete
MSRKNRKLRNLVVNPHFQLKLSLYYIASGLVIIGAMIILIYGRLMDVRDMMNRGELMSFETQNEINEIMFQVVEISLLGFIAFIIFSFVFALIISHRIAGPVVAICAFIDALKEGDYDYPRKLRPHDELVPIMDRLHELAPILREKMGADRHAPG